MKFPPIDMQLTAFHREFARVVDGRAPRVQEIMMDLVIGPAGQLVQNLVRVEVQDCKTNKILVGASAVERI